MAFWNKDRGGDQMEEFVDPPIQAPPVAAIPLPATQQGNGIEVPSSAAPLPMSEQLRSAAAEAERHEADRAKWREAYEKVSERIRDLSRENELLRLELAQKTNDLSTMQTRIYELQQENSDLAALQTEQHALALHLVARYENHHIPLPIRKRLRKSGDKPSATPVPLPDATVVQTATAKEVDQIAGEAPTIKIAPVPLEQAAVGKPPRFLAKGGGRSG